MDMWVDYMGQKDNAPLLNMPLTTLPFPCDLNIVGQKVVYKYVHYFECKYYIPKKDISII
jgi:hypothetical protein